MHKNFRKPDISYPMIRRENSKKKGHTCIFSEKGAKKRAKKSKIFGNLSKNVQSLKIFWKAAASCVRLSNA